jgi:EmrB/QacA subfamily drug resistance transporter
MQDKKWFVMAAVIATGIMSFTGVLIETSMNVTFPTLMADFDTTANGVQWVTTGYLLAIAIVVPLSAYFIRNFSSRRLFVAANLLFLVGVVIDSFSPTLALLLLGRVLQGMGTGIALPLMFHIILTKSPIEKRGVMMGIGTLTTSIAPAIGPTYGGIVLSALGWRAIFWFLIVLLAASLVIGLRAIPVESVARSESFNIPAFVFLAVGLASLLMNVERLSLVWLAVSLLAIIGFVIFNARNVLLNISIFKNAQFTKLLGSVLIYQAMFLALSFILPNYLQLGLHLNSTQAGLFMFPGAVIGASLAPVGGRLLDKYGAVKPVSFGLLVSTLAMSGMDITFNGASMWGLLGWHMLTMVGSGLAMSNLMTLTLSQLRPDESADGNSILNTTQQFVGAAATAVAAQLFASQSSVVAGANLGVTTLMMLFFISVVLFVWAVLKRRKKASVK